MPERSGGICDLVVSQGGRRIGRDHADYGSTHAFARDVRQIGVAIEALTLECQEQRTWLDRARIGAHSRKLEVGSAREIERRAYARVGPVAHVRASCRPRSSSSRTITRSSKACLVVPRI